MRVLIAGGGTGGHLYPGIAIAEEITRRPGGQVLFVGTARGLETKLVPAAGFALELLEVSGLNRVGALGMVKGLLRLPRALLGSRTILKRFRPDLVLGVGGYASGPVVLTAALLGYPTAIQEQNSHPGFTNRVLGGFVRRIFVAFVDAGGFFAVKKRLLVGNPVRRKFLESSATASASSALVAEPGPVSPATGSAFMATASVAELTSAAVPHRHLDTPMSSKLPMVLVVGGSQGARAVNDLVVGAAALLQREGRLPAIVHQTGAADEARVRQRYSDAGLTDAVDVRPFIEDMPGVLMAAGLVVGRAGALTLAELAIVGRAAILIPLPTAAADHQARNAAEFVRAGAALVVDQRTATAESLARLIGDLCGDPPRRARMARAMAELGRPGAAGAIVDELEVLAGKRPASSGVPA